MLKQLLPPESSALHSVRSCDDLIQEYGSISGDTDRVGPRTDSKLPPPPPPTLARPSLIGQTVSARASPHHQSTRSSSPPPLPKRPPPRPPSEVSSQPEPQQIVYGLPSFKLVTQMTFCDPLLNCTH